MLGEYWNIWRGYIRKIGMIGLMMLLILPHMLMNPGSEVFANEADYDILVVGETITIVAYLGTDTDVNIPEQIQGKDVTVIANTAFMGKQLNTVTIPQTVTTIGMGAFMGCELDSIILNEGLTEIGLMAFAGNRMNDVDIPGTVTTISEGAFSQGNLSQVTLREGLTTIKDKAFWDNELQSIIIPEGVTTIGEEAFIDNKLEEVTLPGTITSIGKKAFLGEVGKNNIHTLILQEGLSSIGESAFQDNLLESVHIPGSVSVIEKAAFMGNVLEEAILDEGVEEIGEQAFAQNKLKEVVIPETVNQIAARAFLQNEISTLTLPVGVGTVGDAAFAFNPLTEVKVYNDELIFELTSFLPAPPVTPEDLTLFGHSGSTIEQFATTYGLVFQVLEESGSAVCGENTDFECEVNEDDTITITGYTGSDTDVLIPGTIEGKAVTMIGADAFAGKQLITVELPYSIVSIGQQAFSVNDLNAVTILNYYASIEESAFEGNQTNPEDLTIYGCAGSTAEAHANDKGYSFQESSEAECLKLILTPSETNATNQDVTISVTVNKLPESIRQLKWAEGEQTRAYFQGGGGEPVVSNEFTVSTNDTYTVYVEDVLGREWIETIRINNIDKSLSPVTPSPGGGGGVYIPPSDIIVDTLPTDPTQFEYDLEEVPFTDIAGHWAEGDIKKSYWEKLFYGYPDKTFRPDDQISRMEITSVLVRLLELDEQRQVPFVDVQLIGNEAMKELEKAYANGLIKGYSDQTFKPYEEVTRAHLALIFYRTYEKVNGTPYKPKPLAYFSDLAGYDQETQNAIAMLVELKIAEGSDGKFMPNDQATRAEAATMLVKFKEVLGRLENK